jgi:hypothetical protein
MKRASIITLVLALASIAYALPPIVALPGSVSLPNYAQSGTVALPVPIDSLMALERGIDPSEAVTPGVRGVAAFQLENLSATTGIYPWAVYVETRSRHATGDAVGIVSRIRNEGDGWGAAIHAEPIASGINTTIGVSVEASNMSTGRMIGVNVHATAGYDGLAGNWTTQGLNLQSDGTSGFVDAVRLECRAGTGIHFAPTSNDTRAIWIEGTHAIGIDTASPIRVAAGVPIMLEGTGQIQIVYVPGRIEFRNGALVLGYLVTNSTASGGRLN